MSVNVPGKASVSWRKDQREIATTTSAMRYIAKGAQTNKDFGLFEYAIPGNTDGASPHYHRTFSETFYMLDGELDVLNGTDWVTVGPGDLVYVPRASVHGFRNTQPGWARFLIAFAPGDIAREDYFDGVAARRLAGIELSDADKDAFAVRFDQYNVR